MDWIGLIIQLVLGAVGGNAGAAIVKNSNLGSTGNSIVGAIGGIGLGQILQGMMGGAAPPTDPAATAEAASNIGAYVRDVIGGGGGGGLLNASAGRVQN